jgi:hypothetical protein
MDDLGVNEVVLLFLQEFYLSETEVNPLLVQYLAAEATGDYTGRMQQTIQDAYDALFLVE